LPLYEYQCDACGQRFEVIQKFSDAPIAECVKCGSGPVQKLPSSPAIQFKGSGWYITDYARAGKSDGRGDKTSQPADSGGDAKPAASGESSGESKSAVKSEPKSETKNKSKTESKTETKSSGSG
jgi:putative FmdB family regulatory protein